jgi:hypothetical protein
LVEDGLRGGKELRVMTTDETEGLLDDAQIGRDICCLHIGDESTLGRCVF